MPGGVVGGWNDCARLTVSLGSAVRGWSRLAGVAYQSVYGASLLRHIKVIWETFKFEVALR